MIRSACAALAVFCLFAIDATAQSADRIESGKKVYAAQKCQTCHAVQGVGNRKGPLDDVGARLTEDQIRSWIVNAPEMTAKTKAARKPPMKSYTLPKDDLDALVAYMQSLKTKS
jgi:mono/diheme cytochrome c family protein